MSKRKIPRPANPILEQLEARKHEIAVDQEGIRAATSYTSKRADRRRELRRLFRKEKAAEAIAGLSQEVDVFGLTKGQFSLVELIEATLDVTGPAFLTVSTWTAAVADLEDVLRFLRGKKILGARFVLDVTFQRRAPEVALQIRRLFGEESLRITRNHAKFYQLEAPGTGWTLTCKTSMNLNQNPRLEDFDLTNDPALFAFLQAVVDDLFSRTRSKIQAKSSTNELQHEFYSWGEASNEARGGHPRGLPDDPGGEQPRGDPRGD